MLDRELFKLPRTRLALGLLLACSLIEAGCIIGQSFALAWALANLWAGQAFAGQVFYIGCFLACWCGRHLLLLIRDALVDRYARARALELHAELARVALSGRELALREGTAALVETAVEGVDQVERYLRVILPKTAGLVGVALPVLVAAFIVDWPTGVILAISFPVIVFYMVLLGNVARERADRQFARHRVLSNHFIDTVRGLRDIKALGTGASQAEEVWRVSERFREATVRTMRTATLSGAVLDLIATLAVAGVSVLLAFRLLDGSLPLAPALAALVLSPEFFGPIRRFASDFHASLDGRNALAAVLRAIEPSGAEHADEPSMALWGPGSTLDLEDVSVARDGDAPPVLRGVSLSVRGPRVIGLVGPSGAGKSTLAMLLAGFLPPTGGRVLIDGGELASLCCEAWRRQVLYIPQSPHVFPTTLRENLALYSPGASDAQVGDAVAAMGLTSLVAQLGGLDAQVGEGGADLSGGQAQRIALARALLDPGRRILVLDEPTAHLDIETELELKERMLPLMSDRLVVIATHRLHWLAQMDEALVLRDGAVAEQGSPCELLGSGGALDELVGAMGGGGACA